jgi:hypothetical protein
MYSNSVITWVSGSTVTATEKRGWMGHIWTAVNTTTAEPSLDSVDWSLDDPLELNGVTLIEKHRSEDFLKIRVCAVTLMETHVPSPPEVLMCGLALMQYRPDPAIIAHIQ